MIGALSLTSSIVMVTVAVDLAKGAEGSAGTLLLAVTVRVNDEFCSRSGGLATFMIPSDFPIVKNLENDKQLCKKIWRSKKLLGLVVRKIDSGGNRARNLWFARAMICRLDLVGSFALGW